MLACYMLFSGQSATALDALRIFGTARTYNGKGVTIPSQIRYVWYFEQALRRSLTLRTLYPSTPSYKLLFVRFVTVPNFDIETGCDPYFLVDISNSQCACRRTDRRVPLPRHLDARCSTPFAPRPSRCSPRLAQCWPAASTTIAST